jgi:hypothetical protein
VGMKGKKYISFLIVSLSIWTSTHAQDTTWIQKQTYLADSTCVWSVDAFQNVFISSKDLIQKFDSVGVLKFSQSQKSIGSVRAIAPINTMKIFLFSEEQQVVCILDNTLTNSTDCIDLSEANFMNVTHVAASSQSDKIWVFDQSNSNLNLIGLSQQTKNQNQSIFNINGILNTASLSFIVEQNQHLYLVDATKGVFVFDLYGTLINSYDYPGVVGVHESDGKIYFVTSKKLIVLDYLQSPPLEIKLPMDDCLSFMKIGNSFFFKEKNEIKKYLLLFTK